MLTFVKMRFLSEQDYKDTESLLQPSRADAAGGELGLVLHQKQEIESSVPSACCWTSSGHHGPSVLQGHEPSLLVRTAGRHSAPLLPPGDLCTPSNVHRSSGWTAGLMPVLCFGFNSKLRAEPLVFKQWAEGSEAQYWPFQPAQLGLFRIFLPGFQKKESRSFLLNWRDVHAKLSFPDSSRNRGRVSLHTFPSLPS